MSVFTMRGWPASHFATITAVAGKQQVRPGNLTANAWLDQINDTTEDSLEKQTWEIPGFGFGCLVVGRTWS